MKTFKQSDFLIYNAHSANPMGSVAKGIKDIKAAQPNLITTEIVQGPPTITDKILSVNDIKFNQNKYRGVITAVCLSITAAIIIVGIKYITSDTKRDNDNINHKKQKP